MSGKFRRIRRQKKESQKQRKKIQKQTKRKNDRKMNYDRICRADFIYSRMEQLKKAQKTKKKCFAI